MTEQEAIGYVNFVFDEYFGDMCISVTNYFAIAQDVSIKALEKQIPKEPFLESDGYADGEMVYDTWRCPNCDKAYELEIDEFDYCPNCGQAIKWE